MFNVIIDSEITPVRTAAKAGDHDSMLYLATCLSRGKFTRCDPDKALLILDYLIANKEDITNRKTYWNALIEKSQLLWEWEENNTIDLLMTELVQDMSHYKPSQWNLSQMSWAISWLYNRDQDRNLFSNKD